MYLKTTPSTVLKRIIFLAVLIYYSAAFPQHDNVKIISDTKGERLTVNGNEFIVKGVNWDYFPTGTNYNYSLWKQSDAIIRKALDNEMSLLKTMGVNTIRQYTGIPSKWITYIYDQYGIYTILNHSFIIY